MGVGRSSMWSFTAPAEDGIVGAVAEVARAAEQLWE